MLLYRDRRLLPEAARGAVAAIGNFDGVHLGHRKVIGEAVRRARETGRDLRIGREPFLLREDRRAEQVDAGRRVLDPGDLVERHARADHVERDRRHEARSALRFAA